MWLSVEYLPSMCNALLGFGPNTKRRKRKVRKGEREGENLHVKGVLPDTDLNLPTGKGIKIRPQCSSLR